MEGRKGKWSPEAGGAEAVKIYLALPCYINMRIREDIHIKFLLIMILEVKISVSFDDYDEILYEND